MLLMRLAVIRAATSPQDISEGSFMASLPISFYFLSFFADWLLEAAGGVHKGEVCTGLGSTAGVHIGGNRIGENPAA